MRAARVLVLVVLGLVGCQQKEGDRPYDNNVLELLAGYYAKSHCSCRFVLQQTATYCDNWVKQDPAITLFNVDTEAQTVEAVALGARRVARFKSTRLGCVVE
ncbi:MAG: hypothetical protein AB2A00_33330 [Myxococcota bacterium]